MVTNYQTDSGFFICLNVPASGVNRDAIIQWFSRVSVARFRFILDPELLEDNADLKTVIDIYPGVKTIAIVSNPWARVRYAWKCITELKEITPNNDLAQLFTEKTFEEFVKVLPNHASNILLQPQINFIRYTDDTGVEHTVDYILRQETLNEDFSVIRDYFLDSNPLSDIESFPEYKNDYTEETKLIVANLFSKDIEEFRYEF